MKRNDIILILLPFVLSGVIIFGHFYYLNQQNPQAHSRPLITRNRVESIDAQGLVPIPPPDFPKELVGVVQEIPTNRKQLSELLSLAESQGANTLLFTLGMTIDNSGDLIIPKAIESSEEMLVRWTKKSASQAHERGFHTYLIFLFIEEPTIEDIEKFQVQFEGYIKRWASMAEEYHIALFDPGIVLGHYTFNSLESDELTRLLTNVERTTRKYYTGRIGIGMCCKTTNIVPRGYNQILLISRSGQINDVIIQNAQVLSKKGKVEHIFQVNLQSQRLNTLK